MKTKFSPTFLLLLLIAGFAAITGCERGLETDGEVQDDRDKAGAEDVERGESLEEAGVTAKVKTRLARDERVGSLDLLDDIEVVTRGGVVILKGSVDREGTRTTAEEIARATDGVSGVVNRITVGRGDSSAT